MLTRRFASACLVLATAGLLLAGCETSVSTGDTINSEKAATQIQNQYPSKFEGLTITEIDCDSADAEVGAEFSCEATNSNDVALDIAATVTKISEDDQVGLDWEVATATAPGALFADAATVELQKIRAVKSVDCPDGIVVEKGTTADCTATMLDDSERKVKLTLTDGNGAFDADLLGPA